MSGHTKEPLEVQPYVEHGSVFIIASNLGGLVAAAHSWPTEIETGDTTRVEANAARLVACWNAMLGLDPAALPALIKAAKRMLDGGYASEAIEEERADAEALRTALANLQGDAA